MSNQRVVRRKRERLISVVTPEGESDLWGRLYGQETKKSRKEGGKRRAKNNY